MNTSCTQPLFLSFLALGSWFQRLLNNLHIVDNVCVDPGPPILMASATYVFVGRVIVVRRTNTFSVANLTIRAMEHAERAHCVWVIRCWHSE